MQEDLSKFTNEELLQHRNKIQYDISKYHNFQLALKIQLNSCYGAVG